jgi:hypothetical protein
MKGCIQANFGSRPISARESALSAGPFGHGAIARLAAKRSSGIAEIVFFVQKQPHRLVTFETKRGAEHAGMCI